MIFDIAALGMGIGKTVQMKKLAKEQEREAEEERKREASARGRRMGKETQAEAATSMRASASKMPGFDLQKEAIEKSSAGAASNINKATTSSADALAAVGGVQQSQSQAMQNLNMQNQQFRNQAFDQSLGALSRSAQFADKDASMYAQSAADLSMAADQNRANAMDAMMLATMSAGNNMASRTSSMGKVATTLLGFGLPK